MPTGTASDKGGGFDWLKGCLAAFSPLPAMIDDFLINMPTGTVVIGDGFRRLVDWLEGCLTAFSPSLAGLLVIVLDVLKLMPKGTDAGVRVLVLRDPGNGFCCLGGSDGTILELLGFGAKHAPNIDRCCGFNGRDPSQALPAETGKVAGCQLVP
jgi:hypothetical protein